ncbi:GntR family transcriptional regulator [Rhodobacter aestuarii]|uniref:Transcriptional regulator, GntR family n=1 Tax=Rhodobacter aestuarii TaxID=453582 RepID=A0A1N7PJV5_9RHOB|nr:GntR family transcriptional regulator [Rhodobacter aestuarii]PTV94359.1 GntR family transcriptional regulator [Rhodobacter aestuarii]SIT10933.1 transcriptional regulator, GntR family [Rhodobacter aestuarii]
MTNALQLPKLDFAPTTVADQVYAELHRQVLSLELKPGAKISEIEVAKAMGVSRQPVRDAFYRLSKLGFLLIRPQRATTVTLISGAAVMRARFIRTALEVETIRTAAPRLSEADLDTLAEIIEKQDVAIKADDRNGFHLLDDAFHHEICARANLAFTWELISENKGHMDRVRMLSLSFASRTAWEDHVAILAALRGREPEAAAAAMRSHLSRIKEQIDRILQQNHDYFAEETSDASLDF